MFRRNKTHITYKKNGVEIRPASLGEEYCVGNWISSYSGIKFGYEVSSYDTKYSDIIYVMTINKSIVGYFMAYKEINIGNNPNLPLYSKELIIYDLVVLVRAYAKYSKILIDHLISYANYNGYKAISFNKIEKYNFFNEFLKRHYNVEEKNEKFYIFNENPRIRSCQKHLVIYENDKVSLEDLYCLYDMDFDIHKTKCSMKLNNNENIVLDRSTGVITFPSNVNIKMDNVLFNNKTRGLVNVVLSMYDTGKIEEVDVYYDVTDPHYYEAYIGGLLHISKTIQEIRSDTLYVNNLIAKGIDKVMLDYLGYDMNESSFSFGNVLYKLRK